MLSDNRSVDRDLTRLNDVIRRFEAMVPASLRDDSTFVRPQWQEAFLARATEYRTRMEQRRAKIRTLRDPTVWSFLLGVMMMVVGLFGRGRSKAGGGG